MPAGNPAKAGLFNRVKGLFGGGYTGIVPPVPISNTEVKYAKADDIENYLEKVGSRHRSAFYFG